MDGYIWGTCWSYNPNAAKMFPPVPDWTQVVGTFQMCPICYHHEIAGLIQPKLSMFSTCNHWFQAPSPPVIGHDGSVMGSSPFTRSNLQVKARRRKQNHKWLCRQSKTRFVIVFVVCDYFTQWYLSASTTVDLYPFFIGHYPFPFSPGSLWPFLYSPPSSLPLLPQLLRCQVTVHLPVIADPDIAEVTRLASLLPIVIHSLLSLTPPVETYTWPDLWHQSFPFTCALWYHPLRY